MQNLDHHPHKPVLLEEVTSKLITDVNGLYFDCTIGFAGHSIKLLDRIEKNGKLFGIDYDPYALEYSRKRLSQTGKNFELFLSNYSDLKKIASSHKIKSIDGILFDLGISSYQVDSGYKGLSYKIDSPLDMYLGLNNKTNLKDLLHSSTESEVADIIYKYGEEKNSRKISKSIYESIKKNEMETNNDLVKSIENVTPKRYLNKTLSRVFQSFRIIVNNELKNLVTSILDAIHLLSPGGRMGVITFHSLEDRLIKNIFRDFSRDGDSMIKRMGYDYSYECKKMLKLITKKPISPSWNEIKNNKRARSAKLRIVERLI